MQDEERLRREDGAAWAAALGIAMILPFLASLVYFVWWSGHPVSRVVYGATKIFTLVWPVAVVWALEKGRRGWRRPDMRRVWRSLPLGVATACAAIGLMWALLWGTPLGDLARASAPRLRAQVEETGVLEHYVAFGLFLSIVHSGIEEYYWRWFVYGRLRRFFVGWKAHAAAAAAFSAHHFVVTWQFFPPPLALLLGLAVGTGGWLWSWMYARQGTLAGAWLSHALMDAGILTVGYVLIHGSG